MTPLLLGVIPLCPGPLVFSSVDPPPPGSFPSPTTGLSQLPVQLLRPSIFCVSFPLTLREHESPGTEQIAEKTLSLLVMMVMDVPADLCQLGRQLGDSTGIQMSWKPVPGTGSMQTGVRVGSSQNAKQEPGTAGAQEGGEGGP